MIDQKSSSASSSPNYNTRNGSNSNEAKPNEIMTRKRISPRLVFWLGVLLPGVGHVWLGQAIRGLVFLFFIIIMFWIGNRLFPQLSFLGRHVGGFFIWGLCVLDAYKIAKIAQTVDEHERNSGIADN